MVVRVFSLSDLPMHLIHVHVKEGIVVLQKERSRLYRRIHGILPLKMFFFKQWKGKQYTDYKT